MPGRAAVPAGWCPWYEQFGDVTEAEVLANPEVAGRRFERRFFRLIQLPNEVPGLRSALKLMLGDAGLRAELGEGGRRVVEREYTAARMTEAYLEVYREALGG